MRRIRLRLLLLLAVALVLPAAARAEDARRPPAGAGATGRVILVSLDGTTPAEVDAGMPALSSLARRGVWAEAMIPVFPTNTFPNHVSMVTGVLPERHGIVNNVFVDPERGLHRYSNDPSWLEAEPLWSIAARHGVPSAAFHWVGSQGVYPGGGGPLYWKEFDASVTAGEKVDQILAWLDIEDPLRRPRLITTWWEGADRMGHRHGPNTAAVAAALAPQDAELARLVAGLEQRGLMDTTTLIVVSDHGMIAVERVADLAAALDDAGVSAQVLGAGGFASVVLEPGADPAAAVAAAQKLGLEAWPRAEAPRAWHVDNPRFGDVVVLAPPGTSIGRGGVTGRIARWVRGLGFSAGGAHGYAPSVPGMEAIFIAYGRGATPGTRLGRVRCLDVAPTLLALLGIPIPDDLPGRPLLEPPAEESS